MIQIVSKKRWATHELRETDMSSTNKEVGTYNSKKIWKSLRQKKTSLGKTSTLFRQEYSE